MDCQPHNLQNRHGLSTTRPDCLDQDNLQNRIGLSTTQPTESSWTVNFTTYRIVLDCQPHNLQNRHGLSTTRPDCLDQHHLQNVWDCPTHNKIVSINITYRILWDCPTHNKIVLINITYRMSWTVQHTTRLSRSTLPTECLGLSNTRPDCLDQHHLHNVLDCPRHNQIV